MLLTETIGVALAALRTNKLRAFLTMLGIIIGVSAVIAMVALGAGAQMAVRERINKLGTTLIQISPEKVRVNGSVIPGATKRMTIEDVDYVREHATQILAIQPQIDNHRQVTYRNHNTNTQITATTSNALLVRNYSLDAGRMFTAAEDAGRARLAVVGQTVLKDLNVTDLASFVGEDIRIQGIQFRVIGILHTRAGVMWWDQDDQIIIPFQTGRYRIFGSPWLNNFSVLATTEAAVPDAMGELQSLMRRAHKIPLGWPDDFSIHSQTDFLSTASETSQVFGYLLAGIATVSLLVGGIGIMNIMLVSVTERTREIGIRKALGATRWNILLQFLTEAVVLCLAGGIAGVGVGVGASFVLRDSLGWDVIVEPASISLAFGFAAAVGLIFGVWPARRASLLDPITALRYE